MFEVNKRYSGLCSHTDKLSNPLNKSWGPWLVRVKSFKVKLWNLDLAALITQGPNQSGKSWPDTRGLLRHSCHVKRDWWCDTPTKRLKPFNKKTKRPLRPKPPRTMAYSDLALRWLREAGLLPDLDVSPEVYKTVSISNKRRLVLQCR